MEKVEYAPIDRVVVLAILLPIIFLIAVKVSVELYTEYLWFESLNMASLFVSMLLYRFEYFLLFFAVSFMVLSINNLMLRKASYEFLGESIKIPVWVDIFLSMFLAYTFSLNWVEFVYFLKSENFNISDPIFGLDASFYAFKLPFYAKLISLLSVVLMLSIILSVAYYGYLFRWVRSLEELGEIFPQIGFAHIAFLASFFLVILASFFYLSRFEILTSQHGIVAGALYVDVRIKIPLLLALAALSILSIPITIYLAAKREIKFIAIPAVILLIAGFTLYVPPALVQKFSVEPNELVMEEEYIGYGINFTRAAYGIDVIERKSYSATGNLSIEEIGKNEETIKNIRLWDHRPIASVFRQVQQIRTYYTIRDVDVDRYYIDHKYVQVMISARELSTDLLSAKAKTWLNTHLIYTHGYGVVAAPVNSVSKEGLPELIIRDIPPMGKINVTRPEIYYGELTNDFIVVKTLQKEFDYPKGDINVFTTYSGIGGVPVDSPLKKILFATRFGDINLILSKYITEESKIMFHRNIMDRVKTLAPYLQYDDDPYITVINGKLYWVIDAYTSLNGFPYSQKIYWKGASINYIRNPVKIFVDAYNGSVSYYIVAYEPVIQVLSKAFPQLYSDSMPEEFREHIRYPKDLFRIQSEILSLYHMEEPRTFYNREDVWEIPQELFEEKRIDMEPYYVILKLPDSDKPEFLLMLPFVPKGRDNVIAWLAARSDEKYGELLLFEFPKGELVYGPMQIEARIDQDAEISQLFTLWGQSGSRVIRGNLLVIPIENAILYVEPVYLRAENAQIPELRGVIVAYNDVLVMRPTLDEAISDIFGVEKEKEVAKKVEGIEREDLVQIAIEIYRKAMEEAGKGNWSGFGEMLERLGEVLEQLNTTTLG
jgi:hypothetical protein